MTGFVDPTRAQFDAFKGLERDQPIQMLNLVRLRAQAVYPEGHPDAGRSGREAYAAYGTQTAPILEKVGGQILWRGAFQGTLIGPQDEQWDISFIAAYPSAHAFLAMISNPDYQTAVVHRQAAVDTSRLLRHAPLPDTGAFG